MAKKKKASKKTAGKRAVRHVPRSVPITMDDGPGPMIPGNAADAVKSPIAPSKSKEYPEDVFMIKGGYHTTDAGKKRVVGPGDKFKRSEMTPKKLKELDERGLLTTEEKGMKTK